MRAPPYMAVPQPPPVTRLWILLVARNTMQPVVMAAAVATSARVCLQFKQQRR